MDNHPYGWYVFSWTKSTYHYEYHREYYHEIITSPEAIGLETDAR
jgi:hypothetical protein